MTQLPSNLELWTRDGRREHRDAVVADYRYLCRRAARRFVRAGLDVADLEQVAAIGLIKAADRYDPKQTTPFEAYAWLLVLGELMHHVRDGERLLRAPRRVRDLERRWVVAERDLWTALGREPREEDVAAYVNASPEERREVRDYRASCRLVSFEVVSVSERRQGATEYDALLDRLTLEKFFAGLSPLQSQIVRSIHLEGNSVVEVAKRLGYSRRHLTRLHRTALLRLRDLGRNVSKAT